MTRRVMRLLVAAWGATAAASPSSAADSAAPITVEVGVRDGQRSFFDILLSEGDTERSDRHVEQALRFRRCLEIVHRNGEVALAVTQRKVSESSRSRTKDGKVKVTWRYLVRAGIRTEGDRERLEATTTSTLTMSEREAGRSGAPEHLDREVFRRLDDEIADKAEAWILEHLDELRPDRPDVGFRWKAKYKWLMKGDGLEVTAVLPGSPAAQAGLEPGDRILAIDGTKNTAQIDLRAKTWWIEKPGATVTLTVERDKKRRQLTCAILSPRGWSR